MTINYAQEETQGFISLLPLTSRLLSYGAEGGRGEGNLHTQALPGASTPLIAHTLEHQQSTDLKPEGTELGVECSPPA